MCLCKVVPKCMVWQGWDRDQVANDAILMMAQDWPPKRRSAATMLNQKSVVRNKSGKVKENCLNNTISDLQALLSSGTSNSKSDMQIRERGGERLQLLTESLKTLRLGSVSRSLCPVLGKPSADPEMHHKTSSSCLLQRSVWFELNGFNTYV